MTQKVTREREVWARMKHANIVPMYGYTEESKLFGDLGALISPVISFTLEFFSQLIVS